MTSSETIATALSLTKKLGKTPILVKDSTGFLVNRILLSYINEAGRILEEGGSITEIDRVMTQFGMPMGPFALMDEVGLDVCLKVLKIFKKSFGDRIEIAGNMEKLEKSGRLGKKNGKGFYKYDSAGKRLEVDEAIYSELGVPQPTNRLSTKECIERGVFAMINECARAFFEDKIVELPQEVDLAMIMGTGFPAFRGGILRYADSYGISKVVSRLNEFSKKYGERFEPSKLLLKMALTGARFYS
jgi:3-hydroxyacyl-CoA dehydrogenase/enoyl-CoA hydratase/3-hydroxybutyryl-CoA epimerase